MSVSLWFFGFGPFAVGLAIALFTRALRRARSESEAHVEELHDLLLAFSSLSHVDDRDAIARTICRIGTELGQGTGTALFQPGPGRLLVLGHQGIHPPPPDPELGVSPGLERILRGGRIQPGDPLLVPLTGIGGVIAAVSIARPRRPLDPFTLSLLGLFGWAAGSALQRYGAIVDACLLYTSDAADE